MLQFKIIKTKHIILNKRVIVIYGEDNIGKYEKITNTENLINEIKSMEYFDTDKLKEIAYRLVTNR